MITQKIIRYSQPITRRLSEIGMFKDDACGKQIEEIVGIRAKYIHARCMKTERKKTVQRNQKVGFEKDNL